jgi:hypothetical protein
VLGCPSPRFGAALLLFVGVCDRPDLCSREPPLLVRAQLAQLGETGSVVWGDRLLDRGVGPAETLPPPAKRRRTRPSWDETRAALCDEECEFNGVQFVPLTRLLKQVGSTCKSPGQKLETYAKVLGLKLGRDVLQRRCPPNTRGHVPYWVSWDAAAKIVHYEAAA